MDEVEVRELRYFIAVAEELNFTRAAGRLGMTQPPLSAAIGKLERKLGTQLLERTGGRVTLTAAGAALLLHGRAALQGVAAAVERTRRVALPAPRLTLAVKPGMDTDLLKRILRRCAGDTRLPEIHLVFGHPGGPAEAVRSGVADVALLRAPFDQRGLDVEELLVEPRVVVLTAGHRLAARPELRRADLSGEPMPHWAGRADPAAAAHWTGTDTPAPGNSAAIAVRPATQRRPPPAITDLSQLLDAVALSDAVTYLPVSVARQHPRPGLVYRPVIDLSPSRVLLAWPKDSRSPAITGFLDIAAIVVKDG